MSEQTSLRRPAALSVALLLLGIAGLGARQVAVGRSWLWSDYRLNAATRATNMAKFAAEHKPWPFPPLDKPAPLRWADLVGYGAYTGLTILLVGLLALTLVAVGRRWLWLPVAFGGLCLGQASLVLTSYADWASWVGVLASLALIAAAAVPLLQATRGRPVEHRVIAPRPLGVSVVVGVLLLDYVWTQHYNGPVQPRPAPALALVFGLALLTASPLRRRWLPVLVGGALLAVTPLQEPLGALLTTGPALAWDYLGHDQLGPLLFTLGLGGVGVLVGEYGARVLALWHTTTMRGPEVHLRKKVAA